MGVTEPEHLTDSPKKTAVSTSRGTNSGTVGPDDANLAELVAKWPFLSDSQQSAIMRIVEGR